MGNREKLMRLFGTMTGAVCCGAMSDEEIDKIMNMSISDMKKELDSGIAEVDNKTVGGLVDWMLSELDGMM